MHENDSLVRSTRQILNERIAHHSIEKPRGYAQHRPVEVYLQVASACNLDCYMCSEHLRPQEHKHGRGLVSMPREIFRKIEEEIFPYSSKLTFGVGGEPTISKDFFSFLERGAAAQQEIHLTTNGTRIDREEIARNVSFVQLSLDAATPKTYERIRLGSTWTKMRYNLDQFNKHRDSDSSKRCHLTLCFVLMKSNIQELPDFVRLAKKVRADAVYGQHVIPITEEGKRESLIEEPERYNRYQDEARQQADHLGVPLQIPNPYPVSGDPKDSFDAISSTKNDDEPPLELPPPHAHYKIPCCLPAKSVYILYDGRVYPCCHPFAHQKMQLGDLKEQNFSEIWNSSSYRNLRSGIVTGDAPLICRKCSLVHSPPPAFEDPDEMQRSPDVHGYYESRELDPDSTVQLELFEQMEKSGLLAYVEDLSRHALNLERERSSTRKLPVTAEPPSPELQQAIDILTRERPHLFQQIESLEKERSVLMKQIELLHHNRDNRASSPLTGSDSVQGSP